jgi:hypothetical protein
LPFLVQGGGMTFAAISTVYKGVQMRSRLEARWAAFFDIINKNWVYEPFDMDGWIPDFAWSVNEPWDAIPLFEVKPIRALDHPDLAPVDVTNTIEKALGSDIEKYSPVVLGLDPSAMWVCNRNRQWKLDSPFSAVNWHPAWTMACNASQYKPPRR